MEIVAQAHCRGSLRRSVPKLGEDREIERTKEREREKWEGDI